MVPKLKSLQYRLTYNCNLKCNFCYAEPRSQPRLFKEDTLSIPIINETLNQALTLGLEKVTLIGGEPLYSDLAEPLLNLLSRHPFISIDIETNGVLIEKFIPMLKKLSNYVTIGISIDGQSNRGKSHDVAKEALISCNKNGLFVYAQTIISNDNSENEIFEILDFVNKISVPHRLFVGPNKMGKGCNSTYLEWETFEKVENYYKKKRYENVIPELPGLLTGMLSKSCGWNSVRCEIMPNGDVTPCGPTTFNYPDFNAGNVFSDSLQNIWMLSPFLKNLRNLKQENFHGLCRTCKEWEYGCYGSCRSWAFSWGESWTSEYLRCKEFIEKNRQNVATGKSLKTTFSKKEASS